MLINAFITHATADIQGRSVELLTVPSLRYRNEALEVFAILWRVIAKSWNLLEAGICSLLARELQQQKQLQLLTHF